MSLLSLWASNPSTVSELAIEQIVSIAGDGKLGDNTNCSSELRDYLSKVSSESLASYLEQCLLSPFTNSGYVLQDIVNEFGRRLNYEVINERYKGVKNAVGFDGIWKAPISENNHIVLEVKSTDAYRISLDTITKYRQQLLNTEIISQPSSILIVVGREDTGELESQVRGSRHAWDIRLIGADALIKLVKLKESIGDIDTEKKIRSVLIPMEYTKLDALIDVIFTTARDVESVVYEERSDNELSDKEPTNNNQEEATTKKSTYQFTDSKSLQEKRNIIINALNKQKQITLIKNSQTSYWDLTHKFKLIITLSKRYNSGEYWLSYHPKWDLFLKDGEKSYLVLGMIGLDIAYLIPQSVIQSNLEHLYTSPKKEKTDMYWHISIVETAEGKHAISLPKIHSTLSIDEYKIELK